MNWDENGPNTNVKDQYEKKDHIERTNENETPKQIYDVRVNGLIGRVLQKCGGVKKKIKIKIEEIF